MGQHQFMPTARTDREAGTIDIDREPDRDNLPPLPCQDSMELSECGALTLESEVEGNRVLISTSNALSGLEDDFARRLGGWLALHLDCEPGDIIPGLTELLRSTSRKMQKYLATSTTGIHQPDMPTASGKLDLLGKRQILQGRSDRLIGTNGSLSFQSTHALDHV